MSMAPSGGHCRLLALAILAMTVATMFGSGHSYNRPKARRTIFVRRLSNDNSPEQETAIIAFGACKWLAKRFQLAVAHYWHCLWGLEVEGIMKRVHVDGVCKGSSTVSRNRNSSVSAIESLPSQYGDTMVSQDGADIVHQKYIVKEIKFRPRNRNLCGPGVDGNGVGPLLDGQNKDM
ncbi:hypothetical protein CRG98_047497 [Punica granatum]|uniref:Uncharacterized protein n=1 Tax=Punica granatum TaxID=22663 RepID=A0A2I0HLE1_PUNGR|nr:hypothetical protein CRG98_047497 [Punica granatum]